MFDNSEIALEDLPSADTVDWQPLHRRFMTVLRIRAAFLIAAIGAVIIVLTVVPGSTPVPAPLLWLALALLATALLAWPAISVPRRGYVLRERDVLFRHGVLWQSVTAVPFNRIQHVETSSTPLDRRFGLATLQLYTAGGAGGDLKIDGLDATIAEQLRRLILDKAGASIEQPDAGTWRRSSPLAVLFFIGKTLKLLARNAWQSVAPLAAFAVAYQGDLASKAVMAGAALAVFVGVSSMLSYWFFRFQVDGRSILIRQGVFRKKQVDIKFERIQGINTEQNPVYRAFGLVTVSFDTAGSAGSEGSLPAVRREFADSLRDRIGGRAGGAGTSERPAARDDASLLRLDWRDMIRIGLADRRALLIFALIGPFSEQLDDRVERAVANYFSEVAGGVPQLGLYGTILMVIGLATGILALFAVISIAAAFLRYHNFELRLDGRTLRSTGGLLTRHEHSLDLGKIQTLRLKQGIVQRWQRRFMMSARQAVSGRQRSAKVFVIPTVTQTKADELRRRFLAPEAGRLSQDPRDAAFVPISSHYVRARIVFVGLLPAVGASVLLWPPLGTASLLALAWLPLVAAGAYRSWRWAGYQFDRDEIVRRSGLLGFRTVGLLFRKVQRVTVSQSRYQRRKGLATLRLYLASGSVRIPYIEHDTARQLRDYVLYRVESSDLAWH